MIQNIIKFWDVHFWILGVEKADEHAMDARTARAAPAVPRFNIMILLLLSFVCLLGRNPIKKGDLGFGLFLRGN